MRSTSEDECGSSMLILRVMESECNQSSTQQEEDETGDEAGMVDLSSLTDDQLKHKLLQYGIKPGPIVGSTRRLYEKKLLSLMTHHSQHSVHSKSTNAGKFSDSEEDEEEENEEDSGSEKHGSTGLIKERFYPQCFVPPVTQEAVTDVLTEMFPDAVVTPTGITATKRRSIKGAAGRPVQFKYPQTPASPATLERRGIQQHLVPLWVQVVVFLLVAALLYVIYILMEELPENPFSTLLDGVSQEPVSEELILNSQETNT